MREKLYGSNHEEVAASLQTLAGVYYITGEYAKALERAVHLVAEVGVDPLVCAEARFVLGKALWQAGARTRAAKLGAKALEDLGNDAGTEELRADIVAWKRPS